MQFFPISFLLKREIWMTMGSICNLRSLLNAFVASIFFKWMHFSHLPVKIMGQFIKGLIAVAIATLWKSFSLMWESWEPLRWMTLTFFLMQNCIIYYDFLSFRKCIQKSPWELFSIQSKGFLSTLHFIVCWRVCFLRSVLNWPFAILVPLFFFDVFWMHF